MSVAVPTDAGLSLRPLLRREYDALVDGGFLDGEPVELIEGALVRMSPQGDRHALVATRLVRQLNRQFASGMGSTRRVPVPGRRTVRAGTGRGCGAVARRGRAPR